MPTSRTIPRCCPALVADVEHGADLAIGSRYVPGGITENWPRRRRWLSRWGNRYAAGVLGLAVNDATAGYPGLPQPTRWSGWSSTRSRAEGYGFQIEMTYRLVRIGGRVVEFPITFRDRTAGESKMSRRDRPRGIGDRHQAVGRRLRRPSPATRALSGG